jgi:hypothetical protein
MAGWTMWSTPKQLTFLGTPPVIDKIIVLLLEYRMRTRDLKGT